jgi:hypothetical protein
MSVDVGQPGIHFEDDPVVALAAHDAEAGLEVLPGVEVGGHLELLVGDRRVAHAAQDEGANRAALHVVGKEVPTVGEARGAGGAAEARGGLRRSTVNRR